MSYLTGYPLPNCPDCEDNAASRIIDAVDPSRQFGPGERAYYACDFCGTYYTAIVPEPPDRYEGDGVFAPNH